MPRKTARNRPAGYSGTPLVKKLGIREGDRVCFRNAPEHFEDLLGVLPENVEVLGARARALNLIHYFTDKAAHLEKTLPTLRNSIVDDGMIWVSWPKKSSGVTTDITEDVVRAHAFPHQLVDVKVCAVDETWSGLKLVIRKAHRQR